MLLSLRGYSEDIWRLRYSVPISGEAEIARRSNKKKGELKITGHSGNLLFVNGVGVGYSTVHTNVEIEESDYRSFPIPDLDSGLESMLEAINSNYLQTSLMTSMRFTIEETNEAITILENGEMVGHGVLVIEPLQ